MSNELRRIIPPETFERWAKAEENAGCISAGRNRLLIVTEEVDGVDLSGLEEFVASALKPGLAAAGGKKALASIEDDFDEIVLERRQCEIGEECESCS